MLAYQQQRYCAMTEIRSKPVKQMYHVQLE